MQDVKPIMTETLNFKVSIVIDHEQIELDSTWFIDRIKDALFAMCDDAEVELHIIPTDN